MATEFSPALRNLVDKLDRCRGVIDEPTARLFLGEAALKLSDLGPYIRLAPDNYHRSCVVRREDYELLVLTWAPGQGSVAHDHSGSLCGLAVISGCLTEQVFENGPDGRVRPASSQHEEEGGLVVDPGVVVHALSNEDDEPLVTVHLYSPPLPEVRRYTVTTEPPAEVFTRQPAPDAHVITIIGGGFTGTMTLAHLLKSSASNETPLHLVMIDRQAAIGEGVAYRTNDDRHLLNVPAGRMSAWPERPDDFLAFARQRDASVTAADFCPRKFYGQYIRQTLLETAHHARPHVSVSLFRDEASTLTAMDNERWRVDTVSGRTIASDQVIITLGHRPPNEPCAGQWTGPRHHLVCDPWAALVLSQIRPDEPVLLLGTGLTAVDAILTLTRTARTAPILAVSRRGQLPLPHAREPRPPADLSGLIASWLDPAETLTVRGLVTDLRRKIKEAAANDLDWRQVIDGLRPAVARIWQKLRADERRRFLTRLRPFWEIHRHRMAPQVASHIEGLRQRGQLEVLSGSLQSARADADGVEATLAISRGGEQERVRVAWVINCTGPGIHNRHTTHPILRPLLHDGTLCEDELHLGLMTDAEGRAVDATGRAHPDLLVAGTLRKSTLWESTAVPELRQQAQAAAQAAQQRAFRQCDHPCQ